MGAAHAPHMRPELRSREDQSNRRKACAETQLARSIRNSRAESRCLVSRGPVLRIRAPGCGDAKGQNLAVQFNPDVEASSTGLDDVRTISSMLARQVIVTADAEAVAARPGIWARVLRAMRVTRLSQVLDITNGHGHPLTT